MEVVGQWQGRNRDVGACGHGDWTRSSGAPRKCGFWHSVSGCIVSVEVRVYIDHKDTADTIEKCYVYSEVNMYTVRSKEVARDRRGAGFDMSIRAIDMRQRSVLILELIRNMLGIRRSRDNVHEPVMLASSCGLQTR